MNFCTIDRERGSNLNFDKLFHPPIKNLIRHKKYIILYHLQFPNYFLFLCNILIMSEQKTQRKNSLCSKRQTDSVSYSEACVNV